MNFFERLHRSGAPGKARAGRLLAAAWAIFFAASMLPPDCLASPASTHPAERGVGVALARAAVTTHASPTRHHAGCCREARAASLVFGAWGIPSFEPPDSKPAASVRSGLFRFPHAFDAVAHGSDRISPGSPVPTYLLTLRLRA